MIIGTAFGACIPIIRYLGSLHPRTATPTGNPLWWTQLALYACSLVSFLAGMIFALVGGFRIAP
jgi:hypothetical protein